MKIRMLGCVQDSVDSLPESVAWIRPEAELRDVC